MSLQIADNFSYKGKKPLDARLVCNDIPDMLALPTSTIYDGIIVYVVVKKKFYTYDSNNTVDATLQKWRELTTAGILIQSATIDNVTTSATKGHLILTMSDGTTIDCGNAKGDKGDKGDGFAIIKLYTSVSDMTSDTNPVNNGQMVAIINSSTTPLTAKVYIRNSSQTQDASGNENGYTFFCNLADATVIQGPQGPQGQQGPKGDTPVVTTQAIAATSTMPAGTKITFTTGTGSTATSTSINVYNGKDGVSVSSATINASGELVFTLSDASTINVGKLSGTGTGGCITMLGCFGTAPTIFAKDDVYYNTSDGLIYKSPDGVTWGTGTQPEKDILYISMDNHKIYSYTNNTFEVYGGGVIDISSKSNNAIKNITGSSTPSENGIYVEDLSDRINMLNIAQKTVNSELDYAACWYYNANGLTANVNDILTYDGKNTNIDIDITTGKINLKGGKKYFIGMNLRTRQGSCFYGLYNSSSNLLCYGFKNASNFTTSKWSDKELNYVVTPNVDTQYFIKIDESYDSCLISSYELYIAEIGREVTIDPVEYVDSTKGIEDTPVGEIIRTLGNETPKHYLLCDGSIYNIADYPELAQYFKDNLGMVNYFGGDGITTFGVPLKEVKINKKDLVPEMTSDSQGGYVLTSSSIYSGQYAPYQAFDKNKHSTYDSTFATANGTTTGWIQVEMPSKERVALFSLQARSISGKTDFVDFELLGSNDGTNFDTLFSITNEPTWGLGEIREYELTTKGFYKYYRLNISKSAGTPYVDIQEIGLFGIVAKEQYMIKAEPTYYMELNQDAYINQYCDVYSTDEKIVGKWTDGKPVYRKVVPVTLPSGTNGTNTAHGISNMDTLVNYSLTWYDTLDGAWYDRFRLWEGSYGIAMEMNINGTYINIGSNRTNTINWTSRTSKAYATLEYTKTTDAPNSFDYGMIINQFAQEALLDVAVTDAEVDKCFE